MKAFDSIWFTIKPELWYFFYFLFYVLRAWQIEFEALTFFSFNLSRKKIPNTVKFWYLLLNFTYFWLNFVLISWIIFAWFYIKNKELKKIELLSLGIWVWKVGIWLRLCDYLCFWVWFLIAKSCCKLQDEEQIISSFYIFRVSSIHR